MVEDDLDGFIYPERMILNLVPPAAAAAMDFAAFGDAVAWCSWLVRLQVIFNVATDDLFSAKMFKAYSATARLRVIAKLCNATELEVN